MPKARPLRANRVSSSERGSPTRGWAGRWVIRASRMERPSYQLALDNLGSLRPTGLSSTVAAFGYFLAPRRIARDLARRARRLADQLGQIDPPPDVASEHNAL